MSDTREDVARDFHAHLEFLRRQAIPTGEFRKFSSRDSGMLSRMLASSLNEQGLVLLSTPASEISLEMFDEFSEVTETCVEVSVYAIVVRGPNDQWALYIGSTKSGFCFRYVGHLNHARRFKGNKDKLLAITQLAIEWKSRPEMYKIAVTDQEQEFGFVELLETMVMLQTQTFQDSKQHRVKLGLVKAYQAADEPTQFKGMNRALPVNQPISNAPPCQAVFECRRCNLEIPHLTYGEHLVDQHDDHEPPFDCHGCGGAYRDFGKYARHVKRCNTVPCTHPGCGKILGDTGALNSHMKYHSDPKIPCSGCDRLFHTGSDVRKHFGNNHAPRLPCPMEGCTKEFAWKRELDRHCRNDHGTRELDLTARFQCEKCLHIFDSQKHLDLHRATEGGPGNLCMRDQIDLRFPPHQYQESKEKAREMQAEAAVAGFHHIHTGKLVLKAGNPLVEKRCTQYLGCTYVGGVFAKHEHKICKFCKMAFPLGFGPSMPKYFAAHEVACGRKLNNTPIVKPPRRLFATVSNMIVWFDPKHKSDNFVKLTAYADLDLDFTIFYPEDDAVAPRIQEVDDAPAVADADADADKENQPPPQKKTKLFPMFGGK